MSLTPKDVTGLVLVAATVMLLVVHGTGRHEPGGESLDATGDTVPIGSLTRVAVRPGASEIVFVDVNLIIHPEGAPRRHQVVVVDAGTVTEVGPVGTVTPSAEALVVEGAGSDFLLSAVTLPSDGTATLEPSRRLVPGVRSDLVLLPGDPRIARGALGHPQGLLMRGAWFSGKAGEPDAPGASSDVGGH